jgi:hypothetical protein
MNIGLLTTVNNSSPYADFVAYGSRWRLLRDEANTATLKRAVGEQARIVAPNDIMVAPEVNTSSTNRMCLPSNAAGRFTLNIPSTFSQRSDL